MTERKVVICCGFGSKRVFSPQPPLDGQCTPGIQRGKSKSPAKLFPDAFFLCLGGKGMCLFMNSIKPHSCENVPFKKQAIKRLFVLC